MLLEVPLAGRAASKADEATVARVREAVRAGAASDPDDVDALTAADGEIHRLIASAA
jgi:DNA-binding GntR family transcriptional regulator